MKKFLFPLISVSLFLIAATGMSSIFENLEISADKAKSMMIQSFGRGFIEGGDAVSKARALPVELRVAGTRELIRYAKEYTKTEEFKTKYTRWRNEELGYRPKKGIGNPLKMLDKAMDKQLNKSEDEERIPADPEEMIKTRLKQFLKISATVDFDAELHGSEFVRIDYQGKSGQWKMCFRAGKEVVEAAREEAQAWLAEL